MVTFKCFIVQDEQLEQNTQTIVKNGKVRKQPNVTTIVIHCVEFLCIGF